MIITEISDEIMAFLELKEDSQFSNIAPKDYVFYLSKSMAFGKIESQRYRRQDLEAILKSEGVQILHHQNVNTMETPFSMIQSQIYFTKEEKKIEIFVGVIEEKRRAMEKFGLRISAEEMRRLHLAHEFYHFLEFSRDQRTGERLPPISKKLLGIIPVQSYVTRTNEIAAHQFAKEVCNFPIHPKIMDYCYQITKGAYKREAFGALVLSVQTELEKGGYQWN
ncbi:MAG: hypothetical protein K0R69_1446 [Clostridia bacterium]|jgi:hypothetical protein|nr:hypothetical protein [Clostridia bacterium]